MTKGKGLDPTQGPGFMGIFVSAWQRHEDTDTRSFQFFFFNSFFTPTWVFSKQGHATKVFMQMAPPLTLPSLGFRHFLKLIQPLFLPLLSPGFCQVLLGHERRCLPIEPLLGYRSIGVVLSSLQTVFFQQGDWIIVIGYIPRGVSLTHRLGDGCACSRRRHSGPWSHWK